jgi:8-oxo-dGTP diphosphatase
MIVPVRTIQTFEVSLKAALFHDGRLLVLQERDTDFWELPGGRIDVGEEWQSHAAVLAREIAEELGPDFRWQLTSTTTSFVRQRPTDGVFQFILVRHGLYLGGALRLSLEHRASLWADQAAALSLAFPPLSGYPAAITELFTDWA